MSSTTSKPRNLEEFAFKLWALCRKYITRAISFEKFEQLARFLHDKSVVELVGRFSNVLNAVVDRTRLPNGPLASSQFQDARTLLASLMVTQFPHDVLDAEDVNSLEPLADQCYKKAQAMLDMLRMDPSEASSDQTESKDQDGMRNTFVLKRLHQTIQEFLASFQDWKNNDRTRVIESLSNFYEQWMRSFRILSNSDLNPTQREPVLNAIRDNMNRTRDRIAQFAGEEEASRIEQEVTLKIGRQSVDSLVQQADEEAQPLRQAVSQARTEMEAQREAKEMTSVDEKQASSPSSVKQQVPSVLRTGRSMLRSPSTPPRRDPSPGMEDEKEEKQVINLDKIVMEVASSKYWDDFARQIEASDFSRLIELLTELHTRITKLTPAKRHAHLDDLLDVKFISQVIQHSLVDPQTFFNMFGAIWKELAELQAPVHDSEWRQWYTQICKQMEDSAPWSVLLPTIFNRFLCKLDEVEAETKAWKDALASHGQQSSSPSTE